MMDGNCVFNLGWPGRIFIWNIGSGKYKHPPSAATKVFRQLRCQRKVAIHPRRYFLTGRRKLRT